MAPRRRVRDKGLPENLYSQRKGPRVYYRYRHPLTGKDHGLGTDRAEAVQAARILNNRLLDSVAIESLVARVDGGQDRLGTFIVHFLEDLLPNRKSRKGRALSDETVKEYSRILRRAQEELGSIPLASLHRRHVAEYLDRFPNTASNRVRAVFSLLRYAIAEGLMEENPVDKTLNKPEEVRRQRLTLGAYKAIHQEAEGWLRNAMDLALQTLQRRADIVRMRFSDIESGWLLVRQIKSGACLRIQIDAPLEIVISRCRDDIASPYLVHRRPKRIRREYANRKGHWSVVTPDMLSRAFQAARERAGVYAHLDPAERPTFHEIRSLEADLYRKAGRDPQALLGHATRHMTEQYLAGHEHWEDVSAGIDVGK